MKNINHTSQELHTIAGVEDLDNQNSAAISGGYALLADGSFLSGETSNLGLTSQRNLAQFDNKTSSIAVAPRRTWDFFTGRNFTGRRIRVSGGLNGQVRNLPAAFNNRISSARRIV